MPINRQDATEVERYIARFFAAPPSGRAQALRRLFVEKLDFAGATGAVSLANAPKNVALPPSAERIASMEGLHVVYVPLSGDGPDRVRKAEASAAAKLIADALHGDLLLVMTNPSSSQLQVIYPTFSTAGPSLRRMIIERDLPRRTAVQQLANIFWHWKTTGSIGMAVDRAFDVEAVTKAFFERYKVIFDGVMAAVKGFLPGEEEAKKLFVQTLFNRLMFIYFLSRKGWLKFKGEPDYLNALRKDYTAEPAEKTFYDIRLKLLFFSGLNNDASRDVRSPILASLIGDVPFLNGGLFEETPDDKRPNILVSDAAIDQILRELFDRFNFTVMESTPFDVEVAVDPEMLGKVFEELVTGRHESGSYYTPRPVVAFMCREALKGYLETQNTGASTEAIAAFVDHKDTSQLALLTAPKVGEALARVKVVDPACGSGAYLLGMMQELVELMTALYSDHLSHQAQDLYNLKLGIIQQNLYGADIDQFAVNIAMLRLWLSLAIDYDGPVPPPLPNLDFKIVCGDSLLGPDPSPENYGTLFRHRVHQLAGQLADLKARHMRATGQEKANLTVAIGAVRQQLREALEESAAPEGVVDWRVEFAEVFDQNGGFDVAIANPPYIRQENIGPNKPTLRQRFANATTGRSDLYCYFYARALQLLRNNGMHVFVCSNSWLDVGYGAKLQEFLLNNSWIRAIYDSAVERQFSTASINTIISIILKTGANRDDTTHFVSLRGPFDAALADPALRRQKTVTREALLEGGTKAGAEGPKEYMGDKWGGKYLRAPDIFFTILEKGKGKLVRLGDIAEVRRGFTTGANEFFYLEKDKAHSLGIEREFLKPVIKSPRYCPSILIEANHLDLLAFACTVPKGRLQGTNALRYIMQAEGDGIPDVPSLRNRRPWYGLPQINARILWWKSVGERYCAFWNPHLFFADQRNYLVRCTAGIEIALLVSLNSMVDRLIIETEAREMTGAYTIIELSVEAVMNKLVVDPGTLTLHPEWPKIQDLFQKEFSRRQVLNLSDEIKQEDRRTIDSFVLDVLGIDRHQIDELYDEVTNRVYGRLSKSASLKSSV